jgi:hypothetical protein
VREKDCGGLWWGYLCYSAANEGHEGRDGWAVNGVLGPWLRGDGRSCDVRCLSPFWEMPLTLKVFRSAFGGNDTMPLILRLLYQSLSETQAEFWSL